MTTLYRIVPQVSRWAVVVLTELINDLNNGPSQEPADKLTSTHRARCSWITDNILANVQRWRESFGFWMLSISGMRPV